MPRESELWMPKKYRSEDIGEEPPHLSLLGADSEIRKNDKLVTVRIKILNAVYHKEQGMLTVAVVTPDGVGRTAVDMVQNYTHFHGRPAKDTPRRIIDQEFERTAEMYRGARGRHIKLTLYESQLR